jgi:colanic acid biosynthesis glycosyl transferase WcaI
VKVLFLGANYRPEQMGIGPNTATLSEALVKRGHAVQVCTTFPHFPAWHIADGYRGRVRSREVLEGVVVHRSWFTMGGGRNALRRILYDTSLSVGIFLNSLSFKPDVVVSISPPIQLGIAGALLAGRSKAAHVLAVKDLPLDLALATGMMRPGAAFRAGKKMERAIYRHADLITVITGGFTRRLAEDGIPPAKLVEIPNWAEPANIQPMTPSPTIRAGLGAQPDDFLVLYSGNLGAKQGLRTLVAAAAAAPAEFRVALVGEGPERSQLAAYADAAGARNVVFAAPTPSESYPQLLASADVLTLTQLPGVMDSVAPAKLLAYMSSARPIVVAVNSDSETARLIQEAGCGLVTPAGDAEAFAVAVRSLKADPKMARSMGRAGRAYVDKHFQPEAIFDRWEGMLQEAAGSHHRLASASSQPD